MGAGVVAAGHPATAEAGAWALGEGGNAVDAAIAAVGASLTAESPLTGLGAGGYMLVRMPGTEPVLLDFFVAAPGLGGVKRGAELIPIGIDFGDTVQIFNVGAPSCGVPGVPSGLAKAAERFASMPLRVLLEPGVELARRGLVLNRQQAYLLELLTPILARTPEGASIYEPEGRPAVAGERLAFSRLAETIELLGEEGPTPFYEGEIGHAIADSVSAAGGTISVEDLRDYETMERSPVQASYGGFEVHTNPPPSSGGVLIAYALELLARTGRTDVESTVEVMVEAQSARTREFLAGLHEPGFAADFLADRLGSTTHITALDADGGCASVTCSNGSGSGEFVPGTGIQLNNMLGEQDLNPFGFHSSPVGRRMPSMMSPTIAVRDGEVVGLGSGGSNRIRSAILQTLVRSLGEGLTLRDAVDAPRVHFEEGVVHAEPGIDESALDRLASRGYEIVRWREQNLFFGGVHAASAGAAGTSGAGDSRRGGAVAYSPN